MMLNTLHYAVSAQTLPPRRELTLVEHLDHIILNTAKILGTKGICTHNTFGHGNCDIKHSFKKIPTSYLDAGSDPAKLYTPDLIDFFFSK